MKLRIDLNADLGEGDVYDAELLTIVSSCNIACGGHAGDVRTMRDTVAAAVANNVVIGAHPSYPDQEGFGRRAKFSTGEALQRSLLEQLSMFAEVCNEAGVRMRHVKPHGALYNDAADDAELSRIIAEVINELDGKLLLVGAPDSELSLAAQSAGIAFIGEAFADRAYLGNGRLVPRSAPGAVHTDGEVIAAQAVSIVLDHCARSLDGHSVRIAADTLCVHGDTPGAAAAARLMRAALEKQGVEIRAVDTQAAAVAISACGDDLLSIDIGDPARCQSLAKQLRSQGGWIECVAGINTVVVQFDSTQLDQSEARLKIERALQSPDLDEEVSGEMLEIPVCYGGEFGPDLKAVSKRAGISPEEVIRLHCGQEYRVDMLGFTPGFAYIGGLSEALNVPRLSQPRIHVAAGSIGLAEGRTGVYSLAGPGGWSIVGRTAIKLFDPSAENPFLLQANRRVRFRAIDRAEFESVVNS
jgi:UPF0271 protein